MQSVVASHDTPELPIPAMTRSVVFEVAQPDLGRINIRVAMTNEMVHTYMSSDRSEVGQFLINGQDRLQTALHANGLEMGQFRVDIDRQSAGRSFQQGHPQDQGHPWYQNPGQAQSDRATESHEARLARPYSMLNLVA
jgi:flagellar hook-length control protein FliK